MISDIDYSGLESLKQLHSGLKKRGVELVLSDVKDHVRKQLERDMFIDQIGKDRIFNSFYDAVVAYKTLHEGS
jgi:MFS superfamily sulfate permease-like transporter